MNHADTIVAPATASGGAISIVRLSGERSFVIADAIFRGRGKSTVSTALGNTILYGDIVDDKSVVDDVLVSIFRNPHSYTGEDSVEISCHGSRYIVGEIVRLCIENGARVATAGEFTTRAFLNGKLDLSQAEAVADMIVAESQASHALANTQMKGSYSESLRELRQELLHLTSLLELELDFGEEDVEFANRKQLVGLLNKTGQRISELIDSFVLGNAIKEGVMVAIVGAPNVGKSTLLNRLLGEDRAMVSEIAGTTRDSIEEVVNIDGLLFRFVDTAGLHESDDKLELMGIERTHKAIEKAQVILQVYDANDFVFGYLLSDKTICVINKIDTVSDDIILPNGCVAISAKSGVGVDELKRVLRSRFDTSTILSGDTVVSNSRHYEALVRAMESLVGASEGLSNDLSTDLVSQYIRGVLYHLGSITGDISTDEILGQIFSKFCVGK